MELGSVLIVDDDEPLRLLLETSLRKEGFSRIAVAGSGEEAVRRCRECSPDVIILDVMLPDRDGFSVCTEIRGFSQAAILFLTARTSDLDKLRGFGLGGDDYVTKPFNPLEVVARVRAQLRRLRDAGQTLERVHDFGRFQVREAAAELVVAGQPVACPAKEFQLLAFLCNHPGRVFSRAQLYERVWGEESLGDDNTVMVHIRRLREKIEEDPGNPRLLCTVRGLGYKLVRPLKGAAGE